MDELKQVIAETLQVPVETVADDSSPATLPQWDSLAHLNLVMALEKKFRIKFTLDEIVEMQDVLTICRLITNKKQD